MERKQDRVAVLLERTMAALLSLATPVRRSTERLVLQVAVFLISFVLIGWAAGVSRFGVDNVAAYFGPVGLAGGALSLARGRRRAAYLAATYGGALVVSLLMKSPLALGASLAAATTIEALAFASLMTRFPLIRRMDDRRALLRFALVAGVAVAAGSVVAVPALAIFGSPSEFALNVWVVRAVADLLGLLTVAPLLLLGRRPWECRGRTLLALLGFTGALLITMVMAFNARQFDFAFPYLPLAISLLAVVQLGVPAAIVLPQVLVPTTVWLTRLGHGPFAALSASSFGRTLAVQLYMLTGALACWLISAVIGERATAQRALAESNADLEQRVARRTAALARGNLASRLTADVTRSLAEAGLDRTATIRAAARKIAESVGDVCMISQLSPDGNEIIPIEVQSRDAGLAAATRELFLPLRFDARSTGLTGRAIATRRTVCAGGGPVALAKVSHPGLGQFFRANDIHSALVAPMLADGALLGAITLLRSSWPKDFDSFDEQLVQDLADRVGLAFDNARLHEALRDSEERFRAAFDDAPVGVAMASLDPGRRGEFLAVNAAFCELTGYPREQLLAGMSDRHLEHPADRAGEDPSLQDGAAEGVTQLEKRFVRADGKTIWVRRTSSVINRNGRPWYAIVHCGDITASKSAEELLAQQALYDSLTGIANRHLVMEHLQQALNRLGRERGRVAVLYLDVDRFKGVNDALGHEAGDRMLIEVAKRLRATVRGVDSPGRLGGDEFVIVCPDISDSAGACRLAARIAQAVSAPLHLAGRTLHPQVSIGVALARSSTVDAADLLHQADTAMYAAKQHGRGRIELYRASLDIPEQRRAVIETDLLEAIRNGWLHLQYQPVVGIRSGRIVAAEALLRVAHPERGLLGPEAFIDVAEESDLIFRIEEWVLREACAQLGRWRRFSPIEMAINVSGRQSSRLALYRRVCTAARAGGVALSDLCLEMTERVLIDADHSVNADLEKLASRGVGIAIDDFGTGYSSLSYLQRFPVNTLKIDRTFVTGLGRSARDEAIVSAVTALGKALDLTVVAEGVESRQQLERVSQLGCQRAQGYLLAKPCDAEDFGRLLERQSEAGSLIPPQRDRQELAPPRSR